MAIGRMVVNEWAVARWLKTSSITLASSYDSFVGQMQSSEDPGERRDLQQDSWLTASMAYSSFTDHQQRRLYLPPAAAAFRHVSVFFSFSHLFTST